MTEIEPLFTWVIVALLVANTILYLGILRRMGRIRRKLNSMSAGVVCTSGHCKRIEKERQQTERDRQQ